MSNATILCVDSNNIIYYTNLNGWTQASGKFQNINFSNNQYYGVDINADIGYNLNYTSSNLNTRRILGGNSNTAQQKIKSISFDGYTNNLVCLMDNGRILNSSIVPPTKSEVINWPTISAFLTYDIAKYVAISNNQMCVIYTNNGLQCMSDYKVFDPYPITLPDGVTTIKQVALDGYRLNMLILTDTGTMYYGEYRVITNGVNKWVPIANLNNVTNIALSNNQIICTTADGKVYYGSYDPLAGEISSLTWENIPVSFTPLSISVDGYTSDPLATSVLSNYSLRKTAAAAAKAAADAAAKAAADAAAAKAAADAAAKAAATSTDPTARATADAAARAATAAAATAAAANAAASTAAATASTSAATSATTAAAATTAANTAAATTAANTEAASNPASNPTSNPVSNSVSNKTTASQPSETSTATPNTDNTMMIIIIIVIIAVIIGIIFIYMNSSNNKNKYSDVVIKKGGYYYFT